MLAALCAILIVIFVLGAWRGGGMVRSFSVFLCVVPGLGCLCAVFNSVYSSMEKYWMIRQIKRGVDVDKKSNVFLRQGFLSVLLTIVSSAITVFGVAWSLATFGVDRSVVVMTLTIASVPCIFAYVCGREAIKDFRNMGRWEVIERGEVRHVEDAICQLRKEIGWGTPQPPTREAIEAFDEALMNLRHCYFFKDDNKPTSRIPWLPWST